MSRSRWEGPERRRDDDDESKQLKHIAHAIDQHRHVMGMIHADIHGLLDAARSIASSLEKFVPQPPVPGSGNLHARAGSPVTDLGGSPMPVTIPVPKTLDTEKVPLSVMPRKADGHIDAAAVVTWLSSDPSIIGTEPGTEAFDFEDIHLGTDGVTEEWREIVTCPGNFNCFATTPLAAGSGVTVTVSAPGYDSAVFGPFEYAQGVARSLNASAGLAVSDLTI